MNKIVNIDRVAGSIYINDSPEYKVKSAINELLNLLAGKPFSFSKLRRKPSSTTIVKINHNNIQSKQHIIKQYLDRSSTIESAFKEIDAVIPFGKDIILHSLNDLYCAALDELGINYFDDSVDIEAIRQNSEYILDYIIERLRIFSLEAANTPNLKEHIDVGVNSIVAHAFIECVIMENPSNDP